VVVVLIVAAIGRSGGGAEPSDVPSSGNDAASAALGLASDRLVDAWREAGVDPGGFAEVDGALFGGGKCR
jgi:hypothetical protein